MSVKFWWRYIHVLQKMRCEKSSAKGRPFCSCLSVFLEWPGYLFCLEEKFAIVNMLGITKFKRFYYYKFCVSIIANLPTELRFWVVFERQYYLCNIIYIYMRMLWYNFGITWMLNVIYNASAIQYSKTCHHHMFITHNTVWLANCCANNLPAIASALIPMFPTCNRRKFVDGTRKGQYMRSQWTHGPIITSLLRQKMSRRRFDVIIRLYSRGVSARLGF